MTKDDVIKMLGGVVAQPAQEPVAWAVVGDGKFGKYELGQVFVDYEATHIYWKNRGYELVPVYTTPPQREWVLQREWVDLTDEEIDKWAHELHGVIYAVMADLKEKNNE